MNQYLIWKTPMTMPCHQINNLNTGLIIWRWNKNGIISAYNGNNKWLIRSINWVIGSMNLPPIRTH
ncbi:hypothetical protein ACSBR1_002241 [Camellia fascicularis]